MRGWLAILLFGGACGAADPCAAEESSLELGAGEEAFAAVEDGDHALLVHGPQGGYHLDVALAATGLVEVDRVEVLLVGTLDGVERARTPAVPTFRCDAPTGRWLAWGMRLVYDAQPEELDERDTVVRATLAGPDGPLESSRTVHIVDPLVPEVP